VPTAIKDHHLVRFTRSRVGSRAFDWLWSPVDDRVARALRRGGFVLVGKTTMSELGILPVVEPRDSPAHAQPLGPRAHGRRVERRRGCGGGLGYGSHRAG
jgi:amidase